MSLAAAGRLHKWHSPGRFQASRHVALPGCFALALFFAPAVGLAPAAAFFAVDLAFFFGFLGCVGKGRAPLD